MPRPPPLPPPPPRRPLAVVLLLLALSSPLARPARAQSAAPPTPGVPTPTPTASAGSNAVTFADTWPLVNISSGTGRVFNLGYYNVSAAASRCARLNLVSFNASAAGLAQTLSLVVVPSFPSQVFGCTILVSLYNLATGAQLGTTWMGAFSEAASASPAEWATVDVSAQAWALQRYTRYYFVISTFTWASTPVAGVTPHCLLEVPFGPTNVGGGRPNLNYAVVGAYGPPDTPCNPTAAYTTDPNALFDGGSILFSLEGVAVPPSPSPSPSLGASATPSPSPSPTVSPSPTPSATPGATPTGSPTNSPSGSPSAAAGALPSAWASASPSPSPSGAAGGGGGGAAASAGGAAAAPAVTPALIALAVVAGAGAVAAVIYVRRSTASLKRLIRGPGGGAGGKGGKGGKGAAAADAAAAATGFGGGYGGDGGGGGAAGVHPAQLLAIIAQQQALLQAALQPPRPPPSAQPQPLFSVDGDAAALDAPHPPRAADAPSRAPVAFQPLLAAGAGGGGTGM